MTPMKPQKKRKPRTWRWVELAGGDVALIDESGLQLGFVSRYVRSIGLTLPHGITMAFAQGKVQRLAAEAHGAPTEITK